jgi:diaminopimelate decarboxylase
MTIAADALPAQIAALIARRAGCSEAVCLYGYDLDLLAEHVRAVVAALPDRCRMFYAMKANSARPLLETLAPLVDGFEVASGGELAKARAVGERVPVLLGGPVKTEQAIARALEQRVERLHVESVLELHRVSEVAARLGRRADVLLRVNLGGPFPPATLAMAGAPTQFGIDESLLGDAVRAAVRLPGVRFAGFHLHSLSNNRSAAAHLELLDLYRRKVTGWEAEFGLRCEVVNVGGGIGIDYADLSTQFDWPLFTAGLRELVERTFPPLVRGGTHHFRLPASWQHSHPFTALPVDRWRSGAARPELRDEPVTVVGELCSPKDVLARDVVVPRVRAGDVLVFHHAGAYGWEISHHDFLSHPHPEHVFLGGPSGR